MTLRSVILSFLILSCCFSCAVLTDSQLKMVNDLAVTSDSLSSAPALLFENLAKVRSERGLYYAASLSSAEARSKEINSLAVAAVSDDKNALKAGVYVDVLESYLRALRSISDRARWKSVGTEFRGLGNNIDSALTRLNSLPWLEEDIHGEVAKLAGQYAGFFAENIMRMHQAKVVKEFVLCSDTLVAGCCDALIEVLKSPSMTLLLDNEKTGLKNNFDAYLYRLEALGTLPDISIDRSYIETYRRLMATSQIRSQCVSSLRSLKKAHHKLLTELQKRHNIDYIYPELFELNKYSSRLRTIVKTL